jgi:hypothetical protein
MPGTQNQAAEERNRRPSPAVFLAKTVRYDVPSVMLLSTAKNFHRKFIRLELLRSEHRPIHCNTEIPPQP